MAYPKFRFNRIPTREGWRKFGGIMNRAIRITTSDPLQDRLKRPLRELRMSVIDRCNFRCTYCMPADSLNGRGIFLPLVKLLTDHEIEDLIRTFAKLGVRKVRITGGQARPARPGGTAGGHP